MTLVSKIPEPVWAWLDYFWQCAVSMPECTILHQCFHCDLVVQVLIPSKKRVAIVLRQRLGERAVHCNERLSEWRFAFWKPVAISLASEGLLANGRLRNLGFGKPGFSQTGTGWRAFVEFFVEPPGPYDFLVPNKKEFTLVIFPPYNLMIKTFLGGLGTGTRISLA